MSERQCTDNSVSTLPSIFSLCSVHDAESSNGAIDQMDLRGDGFQDVRRHASGPAEHAYTPYGHSPGSHSPQLRFCGALRDPLAGWYLLGNGRRVFNPVLMRFHTPDTLSPFGAGGVNPYMYCMGDPVNRVDPSGQSPLGLSMMIQPSATIAVHIATPTALILGPTPQGALAINATRVSLAGSALSIVGAAMGLAGVPAAAYVANVSTTLLGVGAGTRVVKGLYDNRSALLQHAKANAKVVLGGLWPTQKKQFSPTVSETDATSPSTFVELDARSLSVSVEHGMNSSSEVVAYNDRTPWPPTFNSGHQSPVLQAPAVSMVAVRTSR